MGDFELRSGKGRPFAQGQWVVAPCLTAEVALIREKAFVLASGTLMRYFYVHNAIWEEHLDIKI